MNLRAVLFDLDDTLHDKSATLRAVAARQYIAGELASLGVQESDWESEYVQLNNLRIEKPQVFARLGGRFSLPSQLADMLLADFDENLGALARPHAGALALVRSCRARGIKTGIVTNGRDAFQRSKMELGMHAIWKSAASSARVTFSSDNLDEIQAFLLPAA